MKTNILEENIDQNISVQLYGELRNIHISVYGVLLTRCTAYCPLLNIIIVDFFVILELDIINTVCLFCINFILLININGDVEISRISLIRLKYFVIYTSLF